MYVTRLYVKEKTDAKLFSCFFFHFRQIWTTNTQPESHFQRPTYTTQRLELLRQSMIQ